jgi:hypothetical protein
MGRASVAYLYLEYLRISKTYDPPTTEKPPMYKRLLLLLLLLRLARFHDSNQYPILLMLTALLYPTCASAMRATVKSKTL